MIRQSANPPRISDSGTRVMRRMALGVAVLVVIQVAAGMVVNLYVTVPTRHPGAHPASYFSGSFHSVAWALSHGAVALAVHASLGLALVVVSFLAAMRAIRLGPRTVSVSYGLGFLFILGAGFNGASFLDFPGQAISSLIMALLALAALCCYLIGLYLLAGHAPTEPASPR